MVRSLRAATGSTTGIVRRVAEQLGYGVESDRSWVKQAEIGEGAVPGVTTEEGARVKELEQRTVSCGARTRSSGARPVSSGRSSTASNADDGVHRANPSAVPAFAVARSVPPSADRVSLSLRRRTSSRCFRR